jgi:uncharacterized protein DUF1360
MASPARGYSPGDPKPLASYAAVTGVFATAAGSYEALRRSRGWDLPERVGAGDIALMAVATYKLSRVVTKSKVTGFARAPFTKVTGEGGPAEVSETARGEGFRRAVGELLLCPHCMAQWVAAGFVAGYIADQRATRSVASVFAVAALADALNQGWVAAQEAG